MMYSGVLFTSLKPQTGYLKAGVTVAAFDKYLDLTCLRH